MYGKLQDLNKHLKAKPPQWEYKGRDFNGCWGTRSKSWTIKSTRFTFKSSLLINVHLNLGSPILFTTIKLLGGELAATRGFDRSWRMNNFTGSLLHPAVVKNKDRLVIVINETSVSAISDPTADYRPTHHASFICATHASHVKNGVKCALKDAHRHRWVILITVAQAGVYRLSSKSFFLRQNLPDRRSSSVTGKNAPAHHWRSRAIR